MKRKKQSTLSFAPHNNTKKLKYSDAAPKSLFGQLRARSQRSSDIIDFGRVSFPTEKADLRRLIRDHPAATIPRLQVECFLHWKKRYHINFRDPAICAALKRRLKLECDWFGQNIESFQQLPIVSRDRLVMLMRNRNVDWAAACVNKSLSRTVRAADLKPHVVKAYGAHAVVVGSKLDVLLSALCELFVLASFGFTAPNRVPDEPEQPSLVKPVGYRLSHDEKTVYTHKFEADRALKDAPPETKLMMIHVPVTPEDVPMHYDSYVHETPTLTKYGVRKWTNILATLPLSHSLAILSAFFVCHSSWHPFITHLMEHTMLRSVNLLSREFRFDFGTANLSDPFFWVAAFSL
jgi:hypothetical protein